MRILLIDDDELIMEFLQDCLEEALPEAEVAQYPARRLGRPGGDFDWAAYDLLLLDHNLGGGETGTEWLEAFGGRPGFPRVLLLTAIENPKVVGNAVRLGADGYLNKANLTPETLLETVNGILDSAPAWTRDSAASVERTDEPSIPRYRGRDSLETGPGGASYRFTRLIGRGGMSRVYLAERTEDRTTVVLKILDRDVARDPENVQRFAREAELISRVDSPYVVRIYEHGTTNSFGYIAMEFFGRGDLAQRIAHGVSPEDAVLYLHNVTSGLEAIHRLGIVHRDLKPGNVMFRADDSMALVDFGLSKRVGMDVSLTQTGAIMGTPYCMSPEQTEGHEAGPRSDIYAAGVLFYQMLTGERPFTGRNLPALLHAIQTAPVPTLPVALARYQPVLDRLLAKNPEDRYQSAAELNAALDRFLAT
jgi:serine/threonine protein kinase